MSDKSKKNLNPQLKLYSLVRLQIHFLIVYSIGNLSYMLLTKNGMLLKCTQAYCHNNGTYETPVAMTTGYICLPLP